MTIKYRVRGYNSVFVTKAFNSIGEMMAAFSNTSSVFKVFADRVVTPLDFSMIAEIDE